MRKIFVFSLLAFLMLTLISQAQIQQVNIGNSANDRLGDKPRPAAIKWNANDVYLDENKIDKTLTRNRQTGDYTLALSDNFKLVEINSGSTRTVTVPANASVAFVADDTQITIVRYGAGAVNIAAAVGVTIRSADGALGLRAQYSSAVLIKIGTNEWYLIGDIQ